MVKRNKTLKQKSWHKLNPCIEFVFPNTNNNITNPILKCLKAYTQLLQISKRWVISSCSFQNRMDKIWSVACNKLAFWSKKKKTAMSTLQQVSHPLSFPCTKLLLGASELDEYLCPTHTHIWPGLTMDKADQAKGHGSSKKCLLTHFYWPLQTSWRFFASRTSLQHCGCIHML